MVKPGVQLYKIPNKVKLVTCCIGRGKEGIGNLEEGRLTLVTNLIKFVAMQ